MTSKELVYNMRMEKLKTEREGMIATNQVCMINDFIPAYLEDDFKVIAEALKVLEENYYREVETQRRKT